MTPTEITTWLKQEQQRLQAELKTRIAKLNKKGNPQGFDARGVWIKVGCMCGKDVRTPFWLSDGGRCSHCKKYVFRGKR